jgi:sialic acid synthase SpsE
VSVFVIAEIGSTWELDLEKLKRLARAIKDCGADGMKLQWTSSGIAMAKRRGLGNDAAEMYYKWLQYDPALLIEAKEIADSVGLEFMCTVYLTQDIPVIAPLVSRFKVSAFESGWYEFVMAHPRDRGMMVSFNSNPQRYTNYQNSLYCVSKYPTPLEELHFYDKFGHQGGKYDGWSDHTTNILTGAAAVAAGAEIIESHVRLQFGTPDSNPDYGHSLCCDAYQFEEGKRPVAMDNHSNYAQYVKNIRTVEKML